MTDIIAGIILRKTPLTVGSLNITWKAQILSDAGELSAITKQIPEREILVECLRALLGRAMGLPIPRPMLLHDEALGLLFGSEELPHPDLKRAQLSLLLVETLLSRWDYLPSAIVFDEWIANPDRHGGNLLADGVGGFWLIDHGLALAENLLADQKLNNYLLDFAVSLADNDIKKQRLLKTIGLSLPNDKSDLRAAYPLFSDPTMLDFLQTRSPLLFSLIRKTVLNHHEIPGF